MSKNNKRFYETTKIPKILIPLAKEMWKYKNEKEAYHAFSVDMMRGRYWYITNSPNFSIKKIASTNYSTTSAESIDTKIGLMITAVLDTWLQQFPDKQYVAEIDLSRAMPKEDYIIVNRSSKQKILVKNLNAISVIKIYTRKEALKEFYKYNKALEYHLPNKEIFSIFYHIVTNTFTCI